MQSHAIPIYPFQVISLDIFFAEYRGRKRNFLVMVDHYSDFIELDILKDMTASALIEVCQKNFARYGVPQLVISDNGTNLVNEEMKNFASSWNFQHSTSAPSHQQANGKAEAAVKIMKRLIQKTEATGENLWYAVLHWRNTPNKIGSSPACRLLSRSTRCGIPASAEKYIPKPVADVPEKILENRRKIKYYYDKKSRELPVFEPGLPVYVQLHPESNKTWTPAVVGQKLNDRSYIVDVNGSCYRRDLVNIKPRKEPDSRPPDSQPSIVHASVPGHRTEGPTSGPTKPIRPLTSMPPTSRSSSAPVPASPVCDTVPDMFPDIVQLYQPESPTVAQPVAISDTAEVSRPKRERKLPAKFRDYVLEK